MPLFLRALLLLFLIAAAGVFLWLGRNSRAGVHSPAYAVRVREGKFEVREYPAFSLVRTPIVRGGGFMRLFHYIGGQNAAGRKIPMTAPVLIERAEGGPAFMSFIMLPGTAVPAPQAADVVVTPFSGGRFAVGRFPGRQSRAAEAQAAARLEGWIAAHGWKAAGAPFFAYYDPPWTPVFFRRNEVWVRLVPGA